MDDPVAESHSFIIKVWLEEYRIAADRVVWRGHITHVPGGARHYVKDPAQILAVILPYLQRMGIKLSWRWRLQTWLNSRGALSMDPVKTKHPHD